MPLQTVNDAYPGKEASASNFNKLIDNVKETNTRLQNIENVNDTQASRKVDLTTITQDQQSRISALESATPDRPSMLHGGEFYTSTGNMPTNIEGPNIVWSWWDTVVYVPSGINLESDSTTFTIEEPGTWQIDCTLQISPYAGGTGFYIFITPDTSLSGGWAKMGGPMRANNVTFTMPFRAGETFVVGFYIATSGDTVNFTDFDMHPIVHAYRIGV